MYRLGEIRRTRVSGRMDNHERRVRDDWVVSLQGHDFPVVISADPTGSTVRFENGNYRVASDWTPGKSIALMNVDGTDIALKVEKCTSGFRIRFRGADMRVTVRSPRQAELAKLMIEKTPPDTSKLLLCPMPGLIVKVEVSIGDEVQEGQSLCTIEAMKMENILRAEKKSIVTKIHVMVGDSLAVDAVIMEFE
jgi:propionyl-CoA carboxylase alpha chain